MQSVLMRLVVVLVLAWMPLDAGAAVGLPAAGSGEHLWLVQADAEAGKLKVHHRHRDDPPGQLRLARVLSVRLGQAPVAAADDELWVVGEDGSVSVVVARPAPVGEDWAFTGQVRRRLPEGTTPRGIAVGGQVAWVLVRVETAEALRRLDHPPVVDPVHEIDDPQVRAAVGLGPLDDPLIEGDETVDAAGGKDPGPAVEAPPVTDGPVAVDRLLRLARGRWEAVDLPSDWVSGEPVAMAMGADDLRPMMLVSGRDGMCRVWRGRPAAGRMEAAESDWVGQVVEGAGPTRRRELAVVDGQPVIGEPAADGPAVRLAALRGSRLLAIGSVPMDGLVADRWAMTEAAGQVAVVYQSGPDDDEDRTTLRPTRMGTMDLLGVGGGEPVDLAVLPPRSALGHPDQVVMMVVLVVATALMLGFWRRDPRRNRLVLPDDQMLAPLLTRAIAGLIDLAPGLLVVLVVYRLTPAEMLTRWPVQPAAGSWAAMGPGLVVIGVTVGHTLVSELLTGRSLGKKCTGLSVRSISGRRARAGQIVVRCLLKALDLAAQLLLLLPVIGPFRQRLGDLVGGTVVVAPKPKQTDPVSGDGDDGG